MTTAERLAARLAQQGFEPVSEPPQRIRAGRWQRAGGAWSWGCYVLAAPGKIYADSRQGRVYVGSPVNMTDMLRCRHEWPGFQIRGTSDFEIHPCDECARV